ncbi:MAG: DUF86 domain-containing protein [Alphaproteobacteria bacterium]|nr:DUF86 domain-containing protein [Alphaproteobacteria bacterium]
MPEEKDRLHILHILESITRIQTYTADGKASLTQDRKTYDAVLRNLQTLSESAQKLDEKVKQSCPEIAWPKISGFRNILVHDYLGDLDYDLLWQIIIHRLPELKKCMDKELQKLR